MKKLILLFVIIIITNNILAQEQSKKIKLHTIDAGFGGFINKNFAGVNFYVSLTLKSNKDLFSISRLGGQDISLYGETTPGFEEYNFMYGRTLKVAKWISFEGFGGLGYYYQYNNIFSFPEGDAVSFPLKINTKFYFNENIGIGLNSNYTINKINNNLSFNLIVHYKF